MKSSSPRGEDKSRKSIIKMYSLIAPRRKSKSGSLSSRYIDTKKAASHDSDQDFQVQAEKEPSSSSEESVYSENSEPLNDLEEETEKKSKPRKKANSAKSTKARSSNREESKESRMKANDSMTAVSHGK